MIKSKYFWIAAILLAIIPLLLIDIAQHSLDWQKVIRGEIISLVQDGNAFTRQQKAAMLDRVFEDNQSLTFLIYVKSFLCLIFFAGSIFFFSLYKRETTRGIWKSVLSTAALVILFLVLKVYVVNEINRNEKIKFLSIGPEQNSFRQFYTTNFKGKVVYVDFWGTTCGPCLQEFRDFTKPLKEKYSARQDIAYLYISQGNRYLWKAQIRKYSIEGSHIFLDEEKYEALFRNLIHDNISPIYMPRYLLIDKNGNVVVADAKRPSDRDSLYAQLDIYLNK